MIVVRPMPPEMESEANRPEFRASHRFENFIAWYWNQTQTGKFPSQWLGLLDEVWADFDYLELEPSGRKFFLNAVFKPSGSSSAFKLEFQELSEGERMLIVLYALLAYQKAQEPTTIIIDEPDNFVALSELQPWLLAMLDSRPEDGQLILVSHNPEIMQVMGEGAVAWFARRSHTSPTTIGPFPADDSGLSIAERIRLGWIDAVTREGNDGAES
jgi:ATPase subunit of ABC transporter with duplicated ATPase domains